jgi:hypothetical protein
MRRHVPEPGYRRCRCRSPMSRLSTRMIPGDLSKQLPP